MELYCGGSTGGCRRGSEPSRGGPAVRHRPPDGEEDAELLGAAGLPPDEAGQAAQAGRVHRHRRRDPGGGHGSGLCRASSATRRTGSSSALRDDARGSPAAIPSPKDYVRSRRQSTREAFVPLHHPPGHAQVDFGEAVVELRGQREKIAFFCLILPHSNVWFVKAYPRETTTGLPRRPCQRLLPRRCAALDPLRQHDPGGGADPGGRQRAAGRRRSHMLQSHYLFRDRFGRPGKGNDKGKV